MSEQLPNYLQLTADAKRREAAQKNLKRLSRVERAVDFLNRERKASAEAIVTMGKSFLENEAAKACAAVIDSTVQKALAKIGSADERRARAAARTRQVKEDVRNDKLHDIYERNVELYDGIREAYDELRGLVQTATRLRNLDNRRKLAAEMESSVAHLDDEVIFVGVTKSIAKLLAADTISEREVDALVDDIDKEYSRATGLLDEWHEAAQEEVDNPSFEADSYA